MDRIKAKNFNSQQQLDVKYAKNETGMSVEPLLLTQVLRPKALRQ